MKLFFCTCDHRITIRQSHLMRLKRSNLLLLLGYLSLTDLWQVIFALIRSKLTTQPRTSPENVSGVKSENQTQEEYKIRQGSAKTYSLLSALCWEYDTDTAQVIHSSTMRDEIRCEHASHEVGSWMLIKFTQLV